MIFPNVSSTGAERIDLVCACPEDFLQQRTVGSTLMWKLCMDALKATQLPYLTKNIFLYFQWIQGCIATHLLKGLMSWGAVLCCSVRNTSTSLPLCSTGGMEHFSGESCVGGYREMWAKAWLCRQVPCGSSNDVWFPGKMLCHESYKITLQ